MLETLTAIRRAGADIIITYYARDAARHPGWAPDARRHESPRHAHALEAARKSAALFARAQAVHPRRRQQPGPRLQGRRRLAAVHRAARKGAHDRRRRRQRTYIDYVMSWGPLIHGHAPRGADQRSSPAAARLGTSFGAPTALEVGIAELVRSLVPSIEMVRFVSSGTEATMSALRVARAATGRDRVIKFDGCYHGHADAFLVKAGSGALTLGVPTSPGVAASTAALTLTAPYNDLAAVDRAARGQHRAGRGGHRRADRRQHGRSPPAAGFLARPARRCAIGTARC